MGTVMFLARTSEQATMHILSLDTRAKTVPIPPTPNPLVAKNLPAISLGKQNWATESEFW